MPWDTSFDVKKTLARAGQAFWKSGYQATPLPALLKHMGIQKGSFYNTFGSKHDTLMEALRAYVRERSEEFEALVHKKPPLQALEAHLNLVLRETMGENGARGCFLVNTALELSPHDPEVQALVQEALGGHEARYRRLLKEAKQRGDLPADFDATLTARGLLGLVLGMRVMARAGLPLATVRALRDQGVALLTPSA